MHLIRVWMTATEIAGLFHTTVPAVNAVIKAVRKSDVLNDYELCRYMQLENGLYADVYATSTRDDGVKKIELDLGSLYNKSSQIYAQMSQDLSLYRTLRVDMMGDQSDEIAIGMGLGIPLTTRLTVKALASSNEIPGYGSANYAIGMEWHF